MTASAIKGDRERCTRSGMDDYLPKPVWSKTLEKMIIKWSLKRRPSAEPSSVCSCPSFSGYPSSHDQPQDVDVSSLDSAALDDGAQSSTSASSPYPRTPSLALDGTLEESRKEEWDWDAKRPCEDISNSWSQASGTSDAPEGRATGGMPDG